MSYLQWLGIFFGVPMLFFILLAPEIFTQHKKIFVKILFAVTLFGFPAEYIAINQGFWSLPSGLWGPSLLTIPLEEYLWGWLYAIIVVFLTLYFLKKTKA